MIDGRDLDMITRRIVALYNPERIYLFGSYAHGRASERSDLDFVVVKRTSLPPYQRGRDVISALEQFAVDMDVLFVTPQELEVECSRPYSLLKTVMPGALLLYYCGPPRVFRCGPGVLGFVSKS
jgi:predicted nucleotidyltransferase